MNKDSLPKDKKKFVDMDPMDRPDMLDSENISIYDLHEDMQTVDSIPMVAQTKELENEAKDAKYDGRWS